MGKGIKKESAQHSTLLVPYKYYPCAIPDNFHCVPLHWHDEMEINYIFSGMGNFRCGEEVFQAGAGDLVIIPPAEPHAVSQAGNLAVAYGALVFNETMLSEPSKSRAYVELLKPILNGRFKISTHISKENKWFAEIKEAAEHMVLYAQKDLAEYDLLIKSEMFRIIWFLHESGEIHMSASGHANYSDEIQNIIHYISENFSENITIEQLAASAHLSKSGFMSKFKKEVGESAISYLNSVRIKHACEILITTKESASKAAYESGFYNISNFNRQFLKYVGCSPRDYRKAVERHVTGL